MATIYNRATQSYIIQIGLPTGRHGGFMRIDQALNRKEGARGMTRLRNQVDERLNELHQRTKCTYLVIYEGNPEMATAILKGEADCPF